MLAWALYPYLTVQGSAWHGRPLRRQLRLESAFSGQAEPFLPCGLAQLQPVRLSAACSLGQAVLLALAGSAAIQIAKVIGAKIFVTASSAEKLAFCQKLGADVLINYQEQDFAEIVRKEANPDATLQVGCCRCPTTGWQCRLLQY